MPLVNFAVSGAGTGVAQTVAVKGADYVIETDAYKAFGGQDAHPSPLAYTLASLSSCNQVTSSIVAKELGITIESVKFDVSSDFDPTVMTTGKGTADATFQNLVITAEITTDATADQFDRLRDDTARRCPVSVLFTRAGVRITNDWTQVKPS
ncbi:OsmC family protein [Pseudonocardia saturnea]